MTEVAWKTENHTQVDTERTTEAVKEEDMVEEDEEDLGAQDPSGLLP
jgi:hypothetical protein